MTELPPSDLAGTGSSSPEGCDVAQAMNRHCRASTSSGVSANGKTGASRADHQLRT